MCPLISKPFELFCSANKKRKQQFKKVTKPIIFIFMIFFKILTNLRVCCGGIYIRSPNFSPIEKL